MYGRLKRKERKLSKLILFFLPMVFTFSQLQDLFKTSTTLFPNVLNRINLLPRGPPSTLRFYSKPYAWFCLQPDTFALCCVGSINTAQGSLKKAIWQDDLR